MLIAAGVCAVGIGPCKKGNKKSVSVKTNIANSIDISQTINQTITAKNTTSIGTALIQKAELTVGSPAECVKGLPAAVALEWQKGMNAMEAAGIKLCEKGPSIIQTGETNINIISKLDETVVSQMSSKINSQIAQQITDDITQKSDEDINVISSILGTKNDRASVINNIQNSVKESINQNFTAQAINNVLVTSINEQDGKMLICAPVGNCMIEQKNLMNIQIQNITEFAVQCVQSADAIQKLITDVENTAEQKDEGILGGIADIIRQIGTVGIILIVAAGLLVLFGLIVMIMYGLNKHKQNKLGQEFDRDLWGYTNPFKRPQTVPQMGMRPQTAPQMGMRPQTAPQMGMIPQTVPQMGMIPQTVPQMGMGPTLTSQSLQYPVSRTF